MAAQHSVLTRARREVFKHSTMASNRNLIVEKAKPVLNGSRNALINNSKEQQSTILFLEEVDSEIKREQAVEEQLDLQMIVDGNTEVILEAYTKESDGGWLQTAVGNGGNLPEGKTLALEGGSQVFYHYQLTGEVREAEADEATSPDVAEETEGNVCVLCAHVCDTPAQLTEHILATHSGKRSFRCDICSSSFYDWETVDEHTLLHMSREGDDYVCCFCNDVFAVDDIKPHLADHRDSKKFHAASESERAPAAAKIPISLAESTDEDIERLVSIDEETNERKCMICDKVFTEKSNVRRHMQTHSGERPFACEVCGKRFADKGNLSHHVDACHSDEIRFTCDTCGKQFSDVKQFNKHSATHVASSDLHQCPLCHKQFKYAQGLRNHVSIHAGLRPFLCDLCGKGFRNNAALRYHSMMHTGESVHSCEICGKGFIQLKALREHVMVRHSNDRPFICNVCGKGFSSQPTLRVHLHGHDEQREMFRCETCFKTFTTAGSLKVHNRLHSGELAFKCEVCGEAFTTTAKRRLHMFEHSGKPYGCDYCDKRFVTVKEQNIHLLTHSGQKPHTCLVCQKGFVRQHHLKRHLLIHQK